MPSSQFVSSRTVPTDDNLLNILDNVYTKYQPVEKERWNQSNIDIRFWAGDQNYINQYFQFQSNNNFQNFYFNIIQQPCNMVTGFQRQHRKNISYTPMENSDEKTATQMSKTVTYSMNKRNLYDIYSSACEKSLVTGMCLLQPYLDFTQDPVNGDLDLKLWDYNSFLIDPFWRNSIEEANYIWTQRFISKSEAITAFPEHSELIATMSGYGNSEGKFYFLPENYNLERHDLLVLSYYWYRTTYKKKMLYNRKTAEVTEWHDTEENIKEYLEVFDELEEIEIDAPIWKVAVLLNRTCLFHDKNPLGFDTCPFIPVYWNYDPEIAQSNLRVRSLVRTLRDAQFLFNRRVILNHEISESSINSGWLRRENSVANEENLRYAGQGKDIIVKDEFGDRPLQDIITKITPNAVPPSDMQLADQLMQLVPSLSGVNQELMGMAQDSKAGITEILRQGAGLVTLQKYFDQWDLSLKLLGKVVMKIIQANWSPFKVSRIIEERPTDQFFSKNFQKYDVQVAEGLNTTIQQQNQFAQMIEFQQITGIQLPAEAYMEVATFQGKEKILAQIQEQQQQQAEMQKQQQQLEMASIEQKLQNTQADTAEKLAMAKERVGRTKSNVGLFEERLSEVTQNRAKALREKIAAIKELLDTIDEYGEQDTIEDSKYVEAIEEGLEREENEEKIRSRIDASLDQSDLKRQLL